jgi:hypothetical protein
LAPAYKKARSSAADEFAQKQLEAEAKRMAHLKAQQDDEEDALDVFMNAEVLPDVQANAAEVHRLTPCFFPFPHTLLCKPSGILLFHIPDESRIRFEIEHLLNCAWPTGCGYVFSQGTCILHMCSGRFWGAGLLENLWECHVRKLVGIA